MAFRGLKEMQEKSAEAAALAGQNRMSHIFLDSGESALVRFVDDDEMIQTKIHEYEEMTPTGKRYRKAYCPENLYGKDCKWCAAGNYAKNLYVFLTYTYYILRKKQNPALNDNQDAAKWEAVKQGGQVMYKEEVNDFRLLRLKWGKDNVNKNMVLGFANAYGTLTDRDYVFSRGGLGIRTSYSLVPKDKEVLSGEAKTAISNAPSINEALNISNEDRNNADSVSEPKEQGQDTPREDVEDLF